jgi:hypothetical protein
MRTIQYEQRGEKYKQTQTRLIRSLAARLKNDSESFKMIKKKVRLRNFLVTVMILYLDYLNDILRFAVR